MRRWRLVLTAVWLGLVAVPLALPLLGLLGQPGAWRVWHEGPRLAQVAGVSLALVGGTLALALPVGVAGAVLLERTDLPGRRLLRGLLLAGLFVPLPLFTAAWQPVVGNQGLFAAICIHAAAGLPWVVWIVGQGLVWVEPELEEEALLAAGPWLVLCAVTLPRCRAAVATAALLVALQTVNEITITDLMQVRTFAEEVYLQMVRPDPVPGREVIRAVAVAVPEMLLAAGLLLGAARRWDRELPPLMDLGLPRCLFALGRWRWAALGGTTVIWALLAGIPVGTLVWQVGLAGTPETWSAATALGRLQLALRLHGGLIGQSLVVAAIAGVLIAGLALVSSWLAAESHWFLAFLLGLAAGAWALPGPVVGLGLKAAIDSLLGLEERLQNSLGASGRGPLRVLLYDGPSFLPVLWADLVRLFPYALAVLWPVVRLFPPALRDAARADGAGPLQELLFVIGPLTRPAWRQAVLVVGLLALGEISAGKLAATPGGQTFGQEIFVQLHYGTTGSLAALSLGLLIPAALAGLLLARGPGRQR